MADIGAHYQSIKHWIPEGEKNSFQERMADCIEDENAWCLDGTFLYYKPVSKRLAHGVALYGTDHVTDLLSLFIGVFSLEDNDTCLLQFKLHPGKYMSEYKAFITLLSMKRNHRNSKHPLMVDVQGFREKIVHLLNLNEVKGV